MGKTINNLSRWHLARLFDGVGVEVGVERGLFSKIICSHNPRVKLFGVDPWKKEHSDGRYVSRYSQDRINTFIDNANILTKGYNWTPIRKFSVDAAKDFEGESLDFVYIDAAHDYESVVEDIKAWYPKVKMGGIISGHDYADIVGFGVVRAVDEFVNLYSLDLVIWNAKYNKCHPSWSAFKW